MKKILIFISLLFTLFCFHVINVFALDDGIYLVPTVTSYKNPETGQIDDAGSDAALGESMCRSAIGANALVEVQNGKTYITIRVLLKSNISNVKFYTQSSKGGSYSAVNASVMVEDSVEDYADYRFEVKDPSLYISPEFYVTPMGRSVKFYLSLNTSAAKSGSGDFVTTIKLNPATNTTTNSSVSNASTNTTTNSSVSNASTSATTNSSVSNTDTNTTTTNNSTNNPATNTITSNYNSDSITVTQTNPNQTVTSETTKSSTESTTQSIQTSDMKESIIQGYNVDETKNEVEESFVEDEILKDDQITFDDIELDENFEEGTYENLEDDVLEVFNESLQETNNYSTIILIIIVVVIGVIGLGYFVISKKKKV